MVDFCVTHSLRAEGHDASEDGTGRGTPLVPVAHCDTMPTVQSGSGHAAGHGARSGDSKDQYIVPMTDTLWYNGISHASTQETNTGKILRVLREEVGAEAITEWGLGVLDSLQQAQVLRPEVFRQSGGSQAADGKSRVYGVTPKSEEDLPQWALFAMRDAEGIGRSPQGRRLAEQFSRELGADLSKLPHEGAQAAWLMSCLWQAGEGLGVLRQALSALQETWRPTGDQGQSAPPTLAVRRLTPREAERLQGFCDNFTNIPGAADGPRYKALGNSFAVPVVAWIGRRIKEAYAND
jgi:DNA (cytosine-5)-methyltransferase 1